MHTILTLCICTDLISFDKLGMTWARKSSTGGILHTIRRRSAYSVAIVVLSCCCYKLLHAYAVTESIHRELSLVSRFLDGHQPLETQGNTDHEGGIEKTLPTLTAQFQDTMALPTVNNTVIAAIAMGDTAQSNIAERFIASVRQRGKYDGYILLLTDPAGLDKYKHTMKEWNNLHSLQRYKDAIIHRKTIVVPVWEEDVNPTDAKGRQIHYNGHMKYKRLKTVLDKYVEAYVDERPQQGKNVHEHNHAETIRFIFYLDIDNVVANPLDELFSDYYNMTGEKYAAVSKELPQESTNNSTRTLSHPFSFFSMWKEAIGEEEDGVATEFRWQGGQIFQDRHFSKGCADSWRHQFDTHPSRRMDQGLLNNIVVQNFETYRCKVFELPTTKRSAKGIVRSHYEKLDDNILAMPAEKFPTVVHITSRRTHKLDVRDQKRFLYRALSVDDKNDTGSFDQESINLDKVITVVNGKGKEY
jgi:hypothetical protein